MKDVTAQRCKIWNEEEGVARRGGRGFSCPLLIVDPTPDGAASGFRPDVWEPERRVKIFIQ